MANPWFADNEDEWGDTPLVLPPRPTGPARAVVSNDLAWIRQQTNGAKGPNGDNPDGSWSDAGLTALIGQFFIVPDPPMWGMPWPAPPAGGYDLDLWAGAAMVFEYRLLAWLENPQQGTSAVRDGDLHLGYKGPTSATLLLRSYIRRYWRKAERFNHEMVHPSGWRTLDVQTARRFWLVNAPFRAGLLTVNGPDPDYVPGDVLY